MTAPKSWVASVKRDLARLDAAREGEMAGCSEEVIAAMLAAFSEARPPSSYVAFMRELGSASGNLFRGSNYSCADCLEMRTYIHECLEEDPDVPTSGRFYFGHHQGYVLYFFKPDNDRVWCYELEGDGEQAAADTFPAFVADHLAIPEHFWATFRQRDGQSAKD